MKHNLNVHVNTLAGVPFTDKDGNPDTLLNICKVVVSQPHPDDPKNIEHLNKSLRVFQKLDEAVDGEVEFKPETMAWIRERMLKFGLPNLIVFAFTKLFEASPTPAQLDDL